MRGRIVRPSALALLVLLTLSPPAVAGEDGTGCEKFAWSVAPERSWFAAADKAAVTTGETLAAIPKGAFVLQLVPAGHALFALPPERRPRSDEWFGGAVQFPALEHAGVYQVTLSEDVWIDVIQKGRYARSVGASTRSDCPGLRKTVRLDLDPTEFTLEVSGATSETIILAIRPAE